MPGPDDSPPAEPPQPDANDRPVRRPPLRLIERPRIAFKGWSRLSGKIRVVDRGKERQLMVHGEVLSVYPLDGNWTRVRREYWWKALAFIELPRRPSALLIGLGGGTQIHHLTYPATTNAAVMKTSEVRIVSIRRRARIICTRL